MRPRHQTGTITKKGKWWVLRYYEDRVVNGVVTRVRTSEPIAPRATYRLKSDVKPLADEIFAKLGVNQAGGTRIDGALTVAEFVEQRYLPHLDQRLLMSGEFHLEQSTVKGYRDVWKFRGKASSLAKIRLREFQTYDASKFLMELDQSLTHQTHLRIKAFFCGVFNRAKEVGAITGANPWDGTKVGGTRKTFVGHAYSIDEILDMLDVLPEPARTVCGTAAFTGLSASELRGLRWQDYDGKSLQVRQKVWGRHVGGLKTEARHGAVPVIAVLKKMLDDYKQEFPATTGDFIFRGEKRGFALNLDNVSRRVITPILGKKWRGWHGFRRGLGTRLFYMGTDAKTVQQILRHANVSTR
jgi:integrase